RCRLAGRGRSRGGARAGAGARAAPLHRAVSLPRRGGMERHTARALADPTHAARSHRARLGLGGAQEERAGFAGADRRDALRVVVVTGGARPGKSASALAAANARSGPKLYVATAEPRDDEMRQRIAHHRAERGPDWQTIEAPLDPAAALAQPGAVVAVVVDCLTLWTSNLMLAGKDDAGIAAAAEGLAARAAAAPPTVYVVTNEVGLGIVPEHPMARRFRDLAGRVNQRFGAHAAEVWLLVCGQPLRVK